MQLPFLLLKNTFFFFRLGLLDPLAHATKKKFSIQSLIGLIVIFLKMAKSSATTSKGPSHLSFTHILFAFVGLVSFATPQIVRVALRR